jgi:hypothetical protein
MSPWKRLLFYLALNVLVSACTMLTVLWLWDSSRLTAILDDLRSAIPLQSSVAPGQVPLNPVDPASPETTAIAHNPSTPVPLDELLDLVVIDNVIGAGDLLDEVVLLKRTGKGEVILTQWKLKDTNGNTYTFPALTLFEGGAIQVHTAVGMNTAVDLYWGKETQVWQSGETVTLLDDQGNIRATYRIP